MARSRSSSRSSGSSRSAPSRSSAPVKSTAKSAVQTQAPQQKQPGLFAQMATTAAGVAVGSAVGHTLAAGVSGLFGGSRDNAQPQTVQEPQQYAQQSTQQISSCDVDQKAFMKCLEANSNDISACQFYLDMYKQCQSQSTAQWQ